MTPWQRALSPRIVQLFILALVVSLGLGLLNATPASSASTKVLSGGRYGFNGPTIVKVFGSQVWVSNYPVYGGVDTVTVLNATTGAWIRTLSGKKYGFKSIGGLAFDGTNVWITNSDANTITEVRAATGALVRIVSGSKYKFNYPRDIVFDGHHLWTVSNAGNSNSVNLVTEINPANAALIRVLPASSYKFHDPEGIAIAGGHVWVVNQLGNSVTEINASNGSLEHVLSGADYGFNTPVAVAARAGEVWVLSIGNLIDGGTAGPSLTVIDAVDGSVNYQLSGDDYQFSDPSSIAADGSHVWVTNDSGGYVTEIDADYPSWWKSIDLSDMPHGIDSNGKHVWVTYQESDSVAMIPVPDAKPNPPENVSATAGPRWATVSWYPPAGNGGSRVTAYKVTASPADGTCAVSGFVANCTGLQLGTSYVFRVVAHNVIGDSAAGVSAPVVTHLSPPDVPTDLNAKLVKGSVRLSWSAPSYDGGDPITGYTVAAAPSGASCSTQVGVDLDPLSCTISGLAPGVVTSFNVTASNGTGQSSPSDSVALVMPGVQSLDVSVASGTAWTDTGLALAPGDQIQVSATGTVNYSDGTSSISAGPDGIAGSSPSCALVSSSMPAWSLVGRVATGNSFGVGSAHTWNEQSGGELWLGPNGCADQLAGGAGSYVASVTVLRATAAPTYAPSELSVVEGDRSASFSWTQDPHEVGLLSSYALSLSPADGSCVVTGLTANCSNLVNGQTYTANVTAVNAQGSSPAASIDFVPATVPSAPAGLAALTGSPGAVKLSWTAPSSDGGSAVSGYLIKVSPASGVCSVSGVSATCQGLKDGSTYSFSVVANNAVGKSVASSPMAVTPGAGVVRFTGNANQSMFRGDSTVVSAVVSYKWSDGVWRGLPGQSVKVESDTTGSWKSLTTRKTGTDGTVELTVAPKTSTHYRFTTDQGKSNSARVLVYQPSMKFRVTGFAASSHRVKKGSAVDIYAGVDRYWSDKNWYGAESAKVQLQAGGPGNWKTIGTDVADSDGAVSFTVIPKVSQQYRLVFGSIKTKTISVSVYVPPPVPCGHILTKNVNVLDGNDYSDQLVISNPSSCAIQITVTANIVAAGLRGCDLLGCNYYDFAYLNNAQKTVSIRPKSAVTVDSLHWNSDWTSYVQAQALFLGYLSYETYWGFGPIVQVTQIG